MKRYDEYKQTGTPWIGEIPSHWEVKKLSYYADIITDFVASGSFADLRDNVEYKDEPDFAMLVRTADLSKKGCVSRVYISKESYVFLQNSNLFGGEIVLPNIGSVGDVYLVPNDLYEHMSLAPNSIMVKTRFNKFMYYYFLSKSGNECLLNISQGTTQSKFNKTQLRGIKIIVPPLAEQEAIAAYLDKKCGSIDTVISTQERRIGLLEELKQSVITEAVTHGINPDAKLRPSGIDWIGNIPEHWQVMPLKYTLKAPLMYGANESADSDDESNPRYIRITDIDDDGKLKVDTICRLSRQKAESYLLKKNDILFARSGATVGKTYLHINDEYACFAGYLIKAECNEKIVTPFFVYYYTKSKNYSNWKDSINIQATIQNIGADKYSVLSIPVPPLSEQQEIVEYIDRKIKPIDASIAKAKREIDLLKELKQSIITEAVTGKIKVC